MYRMLILERFPYTINENVPAWTLSIGYMYRVIYLIRNILRKEPSKIKQLIIQIITILYNNPLKITRQRMLKYSFMQHLAIEWGGVLELSIRTPYMIYLTTISFIFLPKLLLAVSLLADVILLNKIQVFYQLLCIVIIPIIFQSILSLVKDHVEYQKTYLEENNSKIKVIDSVPYMEDNNLFNTAEVTRIITLWTYYTNILDIINAIYLWQRENINY